MIKKELENLDYLNKTRDDLILICKEKSIKGYSGKKKADILKLLKENKEIHIKITTLPLLNRLSLKMVDLFAGTGAFTLAFEQTGCVDIVFSNDMISHSKKIYD
jgi:hypothetical protein